MGRRLGLERQGDGTGGGGEEQQDGDEGAEHVTTIPPSSIMGRCTTAWSRTD
ncbi:MAG: hypothetical protein GY898_06820 [Proteobacteria bacterium]|nr:hypothetical protein [Pseudomonadota bacterium]